MKTQITWHTDENGMIVGPRVHDGHLSELSFEDGKSLRFHIRRTSGGGAIFELSGLSNFGAVDLLNGAIVSEVFLWKVGGVPQLNVNMIDNPWRVLFANQLDIDEIRQAYENLAHENPEAILVHVGCSYGCTISAVGQRLNIYEV